VKLGRIFLGGFLNVDQIIAVLLSLSSNFYPLKMDAEDRILVQQASQ
jgi:hypothetical protein